MASSLVPGLSTSSIFLCSHNTELFGDAEELNDDRLPLYGDVLRYIFFIYQQFANDNPKVPQKDVTPHVTTKIMDIWEKLPIPIIQRKSICNKIDRFIYQYKEVTKNNKTSLLNDFVGSLKFLFSVAKCTCCLLTSNCTCGNTPLFMKSFILDQQTDRRQTISVFLELIPQPLFISKVRHENCPSDETWTYPFDMDAGSMNLDVQAEPLTVANRGHYIQRINLSNFAMECDRYGVSHRAAAALASALMKDLNIKDKNGQTLVLDKNKVERERNRCRNYVLRKRSDTSTLLAFAFDSRKDVSLVTDIINNKRHTRKIKEAHMVVVREPDSKLIGHIVLQEETAESKTRQLISFFETKDIPLDSLLAICSDGEPVNTGNKGGIIRLFEQHLKKPLHWSICLLHFNELPFRHLYETLEKSVTKGARTSTGPLAALLDNCDNLVAVENFERIILENMPPSTLDISSLSTDAKNLFQLGNAISSGSVSTDLANTKLGPINHARWLTKAARILRAYVATYEPSTNLRTLAIYVMKVYIPMYFSVKYYNSIAYGSVLFFKFMQWTKYLPTNLRSVILGVMEDNSFFANSESILLSMISDEKKSIRETGFKKIIYIRQNLDRTVLREYIKPKLNFACNDYINLINLNDDNILYEPPYTQDIPLEHLINYSKSDEVLLKVKIPCHIQNTERNVQELTRASKHVTEKYKPGFLATSAESREKMPRFESKRDFQ